VGSLLSINIVDGLVVTIFVVLSIAALVYLILRRRWAVGLIIAAVGGAIIAAGTIYLCEVVLNLFGVPLEFDTHTWVVLSFAATGIAIFTIIKSRGLRRVIASVAVVLFLSTATLGINASYGLNTTVASLLGIEIGKPLTLPSRTPIPSASPTAISATPTPIPVPKALWETWTPPAGMPTTGQYGTVVIPNTASGFAARPAYLYLPPAALVPNPPALPVLIMMMGQPGGPDSSIKFLPNLNALAAANKGLGPIVLTIDQIGSPTQNPLCIDSPRGNVHTYVMTDVLAYLRNNLHVSTVRRNWAIGGYSNGGECALSFGAQYPQTFGSILDVSGEIGPSLGSPADTLRIGFGGDQARYDAEQPLNIMAKTRYTDMFAIFTSGSNDHYYGPESDQANAAAQAAGMTTLRAVGPGVGHRSDAIVFGVPVGLDALYPRWGLSAPK